MLPVVDRPRHHDGDFSWLNGVGPGRVMKLGPGLERAVERVYTPCDHSTLTWSRLAASGVVVVPRWHQQSWGAQC